MISHKHKIIFIHIPKCAGSSIERFFGIAPFKWRECNRLHLTGWDPQHHIHLQHARAKDLLDKKLVTQKTWQSYFKFTIVRNPFDRAYSDYLWIKKDYKIEGSFEEYINGKGAFEPFLSNFDKKETRADHLYNQYEFIYDDKENLLVDFVARFENLEADFEKVCRLSGIRNERLPHEKKRENKKNYQDFFDLDKRKLVEMKFKKDLQFFNYNF